jgi:glycosidase
MTPVIDRHMVPLYICINQKFDPGNRKTMHNLQFMYHSQPYTQHQHSALFQINTRVWLTELERQLGHKVTLDDVDDKELDLLAERGFQWVWLLSVWTLGPQAREISRIHPGWLSEFHHTLPDLEIKDISGSGFAIAAYDVPDELGGRTGLERFRERLRRRGLKLMLDFVPNHMGPDHPWVFAHPDYFVTGTRTDLERDPQNYTLLETVQGPTVFAYGRDPYFDGWPDTVQIDYSNPASVAAMMDELTRIAGQCDGVRCDMAMLILPDIFEKTWGRKALSFWPEAIRSARKTNPDFCFMAEVYWDKEWELQQLGFDYTYDKRLYDRLHQARAMPVVQHLIAGEDFQRKSVRFLENHDEVRAATAFQWPMHKAAAIVTYTIPGMRFFHQGQLEGRRIKISPHLSRGPYEADDPEISGFYRALLSLIQLPVLRSGSWTLLNCRPAWSENPTYDACIAYSWKGEAGERILVSVNYADHQSQCYVSLPFQELEARQWKLTDLAGDAVYIRNGHELLTNGLYLDIGPWQYHVFKLTEILQEEKAILDDAVTQSQRKPS